MARCLRNRLNTKLVAKGYKLVYDPTCFNIHRQRPWGFRFIRNIFWLMEGQGSLTMDRLSPSSKLYLLPPLFTTGLVTSPFLFTLPFFQPLIALAAGAYVMVLLAETFRLVTKYDLQLLQGLKTLFIFPLALFMHHTVSGVGFIFGFFRQLRRKFGHNPMQKSR